MSRKRDSVVDEISKAIGRRRDDDDDPAGFKCSFCKKHQSQVRKLIAGPDVFICDECIDLCVDILAEEIAPEHGRDVAAQMAHLKAQAAALTRRIDQLGDALAVREIGPADTTSTSNGTD